MRRGRAFLLTNHQQVLVETLDDYFAGKENVHADG